MVLREVAGILPIAITSGSQVAMGRAASRARLEAYVAGRWHHRGAEISAEERTAMGQRACRISRKEWAAGLDADGNGEPGTGMLKRLYLDKLIAGWRDAGAQLGVPRPRHGALSDPTKPGRSHDAGLHPWKAP